MSKNKGDAKDSLFEFTTNPPVGGRGGRIIALPSIDGQRRRIKAIRPLTESSIR